MSSLPLDVTRCTSEICRDRYQCLRWLDSHTDNPMQSYSDFLEDQEMSCKHIINEQDRSWEC